MQVPFTSNKDNTFKMLQIFYLANIFEFRWNIHGKINYLWYFERFIGDEFFTVIDY